MSNDLIIGKRWTNQEAKAEYDRLSEQVQFLQRRMQEQFEMEAGPLLDKMMRLSTQFEMPCVVMPSRPFVDPTSSPPKRRKAGK